MFLRTSLTLSFGAVSVVRVFELSTLTTVWILLNFLPPDFALLSSPSCRLLCRVLHLTTTQSVSTSTTLIPPSSPSFLPTLFFSPSHRSLFFLSHLFVPRPSLSVSWPLLSRFLLLSGVLAARASSSLSFFFFILDAEWRAPDGVTSKATHHCC